MSTHYITINQHILDCCDKSYEHHQQDFFFSFQISYNHTLALVFDIILLTACI